MKGITSNSGRSALDAQKAGKLFAAVVVGLSVGTLLPPDPVALPVVGSASGVLVGGLGLVVGVGLFLQLRASATDCGCSGDCGCS